MFVADMPMMSSMHAQRENISQGSDYAGTFINFLSELPTNGIHASIHCFGSDLAI